MHGVAVVAMHDPVFGEKACAFVTLNPGRSLTFEELKTFLIDQKIAKFKLRERTEILQEFQSRRSEKFSAVPLGGTIDAKLANEPGNTP